MKLSNYLPEIPGTVALGQKMNNIINTLELSKASSGTTYRPASFGIDQIVSTWIRQSQSYRYQMVMDLQTIAHTVEEIRSPITQIVNEVFRRGIKWQAKFAVKCEQCDIEYPDNVEKCEKCKSSDNLTLPDEDQKKTLTNFMDDANLFDKSLEETLRTFLFDINSVDDGFVYLVKEYYGEDDIKKPVRSRVIELRRLHPALIEFDLDIQGLPKNSHWVCYLHRDDSPAAEPGYCSECGRGLVPAMYIYCHRSQAAKKYLLDSEIIHSSKFSHSETYGFSPIMTVFEQALTLIGMSRNLYSYFWERRMPASMIMVFTDDPESLRRERENIISQMRLDPNTVPMVAVSAKQGRGRVDMVRLMHTLQEMDYLPVRQEIRERIAAMWGVTPIWQGAPDAMGGLNSQTSQLTVMSRVVEGDQRIFHEKVFPQILDAFGITDWKLELPNPEEEAEQTRIAFAQQKMQVASMAQQMGFDVKIKSQDVGIAELDFIISGEATKPQMMGLGGGQGGGMMPQQMGSGEQEPQMGTPQPGDGNPAETQGQPQQGNQPLSLMMKNWAGEGGWIGQLMEKGYMPIIKKINPDGTTWFVSGGQDLIARFSDGNLIGVEKAVFRNTIPKYKRKTAKSPNIIPLSDTDYEEDGI
ncbi:MAG: hypothetical protein AABX79_00045 [Nanoarchaeota archaeon]